MFKLIRDNDKNEEKLFAVKQKLSNANDRFIKMLERVGIKNIHLTSFGNSIATGYAMNDDIYPMLKRNKDLLERIKQLQINASFHSFARAQDNNDEHLLDWIVNNISESEINKLVHVDFDAQNKNSMDARGIKSEDVDKLYPSNPEIDMGLQDLVKLNSKDLANIIVYNGATASFLDNLTRHGKHLNLYGFFRDFKSMEAILKTIYLINPNTQVYICGIPNLGKINAVYFLNQQIKKICSNYPNCVYVSPIPQNFIYKKNGKILVDIHYNNEEYLQLNNNIIESITGNYEQVRLFVELDRRLKRYSADAFKSNSDLRYDGEKINEVITELLEKHKEIITPKFLKKVLKYYKEKYPHDYYYTPRKTVIETLRTK